MRSNGAYTFEQLSIMPAYVYHLIKRSVDLEVIKQRKLFISDVATAFSDPKKGIRSLEKQEKELEQIYDSFSKKNSNFNKPSSVVNWDFPDDAADKLKKWQR